MSTQKNFTVNINLFELIYYVFSRHCKLPLYEVIKGLGWYSKNKSWPYIPSNEYAIYEFIKHFLDSNLLDKNRTLSNIKFMDIGCGYPVIGEIMRLIGLNQSNIYGLEYNIDIVHLLKNKIANLYIPTDNIYHGDLCKHDFKLYDLLYCYNPIREPELMVTGLKNITKTMKKGAVLYFFNAGTPSDQLHNLGFVHIPNTGLHIFKK